MPRQKTPRRTMSHAMRQHYEVRGWVFCKMCDGTGEDECWNCERTGIQVSHDHFERVPPYNEVYREEPCSRCCDPQGRYFGSRPGWIKCQYCKGVGYMPPPTGPW
jgi:hypothetical protein